MKKLAMVLAIAFTMGLASTSVKADDKKTEKKATTECTAKEKKACASSDKKACCSQGAATETAKTDKKK